MDLALPIQQHKRGRLGSFSKSKFVTLAIRTKMPAIMPGGQAQLIEPKVKYKSPKAKTKVRAKKPQEAFNFGGANE
ncbi:hypothetical protein [Vibrio paracholerae]|uniref:hypothetical protein n=1 Tax=Vibrio paracholerae TaxID=650003 RepID=UPI0020961C93|nr:hypothetical protein [Vibrio paracholerae]